MTAIRAFAMRFDLPRAPSVRETERADLSTLSDRASGHLAPDALHVAPPRRYWTPLERPIPGLLVEGALPPDHFARFVLRLPREWNGRLAVSAASGITDERTYDLYFSDYLLSRGYAFACTDKGVRRAVLDGDTVLMPHLPENSVRAWTGRLSQLAAFTRGAAEKRYGRAPEKTFAVGLSNGGFVARRAAETAPELFDGALEVSGVMWRADRGGLLRELPPALRATAKASWDREALRRAGFPCGDRSWDPVVSLYRSVYWEAVMHLFLGDLDPTYAGPVERYDLDARPRSVRAAIESFQNTGDLKMPLVSVAGARDLLISCAGHALAYRDLVAGRGKAQMHRLVVVENASHIDTNAETFPFVEPLMPHAHRAFEELEALAGGYCAVQPPSTVSAAPRI